MKVFNIVFFGTPHFSTHTLQVLHEHKNIKIKAAVTGIDKKVGRGQKVKETSVAQHASDLMIPVIKSVNINQEISKLKDLGEIDFFIVVAFSQFLSKDILSLPSLGSFNIHTSLLPRYRGAAPIQYALLNGDKKTGICIQKMVSKMDAGDIAVKKVIAIDDHDTSQTLFEKFEHECRPLLETFIGDLLNDDLSFEKQDESEVSYAPIIYKKDGLIDFSTISAEQAVNKMRAYTPWPGTYTYVNKIRIKIIEMINEGNQVAPGIIDTSMNTLVVGTKEGSVRLAVVQLEGKKPIRDFEFINGQKNKFDQFLITIPDSDEVVK